MRSRNNNFKAKNVTQNVLRGAGFVSVGVLALLGILAISPITSRADAANGWDEELKNYRETASTVTLSMDSGTNSVVNAGNTNTNVGVVKRTASVTLGNTNGYSVYIRANSANLTGSNSSNTIPSVTSNSTLSQMTDKWGWNGNVGDSVTDCSLSDVFKQMTTSNQTLGSGGAVSSGTKKVTMCFGTRVSEAKVADTYSNTVTLSVVAQPGRTAAFGGITNMQQMTASICSAAPYHETAQLTDTRDGKKYWVTKMLDGNCWMSQNLALDLSTSKALTSADSDVASSWTPTESTTALAANGSTSMTGDSSWNFGKYVLNKPTSGVGCSGSAGDLSVCSDQDFVNVADWRESGDSGFYKATNYKGSDGVTDCVKEANTAAYPGADGACRVYDAHYLIGDLYQWSAATTGTVGTVSDVTANGSVCPKNWELPKGGETTALQSSGSFSYLLQQYGLTNAPIGTSSVNGLEYDVALLPLFFNRSGYLYLSLFSSNSFSNLGTYGYYWTSRAGVYSGGKAASSYSFNFDMTTLMPEAAFPRNYGCSVRCLVNVS